MDDIIQFIDNAIKEKQQEIETLKAAKRELRGNNSSPRRETRRRYRKPGQTLQRLREFAEKNEVFSPGDAGKEVGSTGYVSSLLRTQSDIADPEERAADGRVKLYRSKLFKHEPLNVD